MIHKPVLQKEVLQYLEPKPNENFIDATFGGGGHTAAILEENKPSGKVLGIEIDPELYQKLKSEMAEFSIFNFQFSKRLVLVNDSYTNLKEIVKRENFGPVAGILFDLGMSSWHLEKSGRGFTFQKDEPLDMRYNVTHIRRPSYMCYKMTAAEIVNKWEEKEIEKILKEYGEERFSRRIAKEIVKTRKAKPIKRTFQLVKIIKQATPSWYHHKKIHPATKTFQALRIAVNDELNNLKKALPQAQGILEPEGRLVTISFHSLEDKICKNFLRKNSGKGLIEILTKKPIRPNQSEISKNPGSRSARLRAAKKL